MEYQGPTGLLKDDEPAFPVDAKYGLNTEYSVGMSLRDYFAAAALPACIAGQMRYMELAANKEFAPNITDKQVAEDAYRYADEMLKARK